MFPPYKNTFLYKIDRQKVSFEFGRITARQVKDPCVLFLPQNVSPKLTNPIWCQGSSATSLWIKGPPESPVQLSFPKMG